MGCAIVLVRSTMRIIFVIGPAASGKSTYIKNNFPDAKVVDLWDYQENCYSVPDIIKSYMMTEKALKETIKQNLNTDNIVILEHTLLMAKRRPQYIDAVRSLTDTPIEVHVMHPSKKVYKQRCESKGIPPRQMEMDMLEIPTEDEGFSIIEVIKD